MSSLVFQSERLLCRRWIPDDLESLIAVYTDPVAMRHVGDSSPITRSDCEEWFRVTEANYAKRGYGMFTLVETESRLVVGFAGLVHPAGQSEPEIKYALLRSHWGRGFGSELVPHLLSYGSRVHGLTRVIATVAKGNLASQRVLAKAGMCLVQSRSNDDGSTTLVFEWLASSAA